LLVTALRRVLSRHTEGADLQRAQLITALRVAMVICG
jgi:hypothetical protein